MIREIERIVPELSDAIRLKAKCRIELEEARRALEELKATSILEIALEIGDNGKPVYSNEKLREAELTRRMSYDDNLRLAVEKAAKNENTYLMACADVDALTWEAKARLAIMGDAHESLPCRAAGVLAPPSPA